MASLTGPMDSYVFNNWTVNNNYYDQAAGQTYSVTGTYNPANPTSGVKFNWNLGPLPKNGVFYVHAFPELTFGQNPLSTTIDPTGAPFPIHLTDLTTYKVNYNLGWGGDTAGYNVALEMYLNSDPTGGAASYTNEIMVWVHTGGFHPTPPVKSTYSDRYYSGQIYDYPVSQYGLNFRYTAILSTKDQPAGTIDVAAILQWLKTKGYITGNEYLENIQVGAEVAAGKGSLSINNFQLDIASTNNPEVLVDGSGMTTVTTPPPPPPVLQGVLSTDFDGDGKSEIMWTSGYGQAIVYGMDGTKLLATSVAVGDANSAFKVIAAADFDGNGTADILRQKSDGTAQVWIMQGYNLVGGHSVGATPGSAWKIIGAGDFNADGKADILWQNTNGQPMVWMVNGWTLLSQAKLTNPGSAWRVIGTGDLDGDHATDILFQNNTTGNAMVWLMNGSTVLSKTDVGSAGTGAKLIGAGDFDGDGKADLLWQLSTGDVAIWQMDGATVTNTTTLTGPGTGWTALGTEDFNGDRMADILWQGPNRSTQVWLMSGTNILAQSTLTTNPGSSWHAIG